MTSLIVIISFSLAGALIVMMALGIVLAVFMPAMDRWNKRYFIVLFSVLFLLSLSCFFALLYWEDPTKAVAERIVYIFESMFLPGLVFMPTLFMLHSSGEHIVKSMLFKLVILFLGIYSIMLIVTQFTGAVYDVTPDNQFIQGRLYALWVMSLAMIMVLNIAGVLKRRKRLSKRLFSALLIYLVPMTAALFLHIFVNVEVILVFGMALFALLMFGIILRDNIEHYMKQQQVIANQHADIMALQMRPHFICNAMMGIYYLCDQDPDKAKQVTLDFTTYLRKNFAAFASESMVPFRDELEHTRAYLAVEQAQLEDSLFVSFDTPHILFRVPPLTLQPIVENAVKHGMTSSNDPVHISVVTVQTDTANEIIVEDDGPGFNPVDDDEPHIALNNIRQRLEMICKGKLIISSRESGGTSVKVTVPIEKED
ncbi:MAG: histidine kinase [Eubacterium sp.]|nr:histidine kinase [Eubacterium sp.]